MIICSLWSFADKNCYARKKNRRRIFSYEFNRLSAEFQNDIDKAAQAILAKHTESMISVFLLLFFQLTC
ncbi:ParB family protein [Enterobacteriaceae bacterium LUAb1]